MLICHDCGHKFRRHVRTVGTGKKVPAWACAYRVDSGGSGVCTSHHVNENVVERTYLEAIAATEQEIVEVQEAVLKLHKDKQTQLISAADYNAELQHHKTRKQELESKLNELQATGNRFAEISAWLETFSEHTKNSETLNTVDAIVIKALVDHIVMKDTSMEIHFKCGATIEQEYAK